MKKLRGIFNRGGVLYIRFSGPDGRMVKESAHTKDPRAAEALRIKRKAEVMEGRYTVKPRVAFHTFNDLAKAYLPWAEKQRSFIGKRNSIARLCERFGPVPLRNFNTMMLEKFQAERIKDGKKPATSNREMALIKHMFTKAVEWDFVEEDALKRVRKVKLLKENNRRLRYLSPEECQALIAECAPHLRPIVITALSTGMRWSEIVNLKWENVDLRHGLILLTQDMTKNAERREIPISDTLRAALGALPRRLDIPFVFHDPTTGSRWVDLKKCFHAALRRAGIYDFRFHDLRHTAASHLVQSGADLLTVKELLGHKTLTMTMRYAHLSPGHRAKAVKALDASIFGGASDPKSGPLAISGGSKANE